MKNIMNEYLNYIKKTSRNYMKAILSNYYDEDHFNALMEVYINARYYNYYEQENDDFEDDVCRQLRKRALLILEDSDEIAEKKITELLFSFNFLLYLNGLKAIKKKEPFIRYINDYRNRLLNKIDETFSDKFSKLIDETIYKEEKYLNLLLECPFYLEFSKTSVPNISTCYLNHDIKFPKLYSDYAIERVYNSGVVYEEQLLIGYMHVVVQIIRDFKNNILDNYYLLDFASSLFAKKDTIAKNLETLNNDAIKDRVVLKIGISDYEEHEDIVKDLMREGYSFGLYLKEKEFANNVKKHTIFKYIVVNKQPKDCNNDKINDKIIVVE